MIHAGRGEEVEIVRVGIVRREKWTEDRDYGEHDHDHDPDHRLALPSELAPEATLV